MSDYLYPSDSDWIWIASDRDGYLAAFVTAGQGPILRKAFALQFHDIEFIAETFYALPQVSQILLYAELPRPDDFIALAERGFYAYDWSDVHKSSAKSKNAYELIAAPVSPLRWDALPERLATLVKQVQLHDVTFADHVYVTLDERYECLRLQDDQNK